MLRPDGTLWLNLGDSYSGSGRGGNPAPESSGLQGSQESQQKFRGLQPKPARSSIEIGRTSRDAAVTNLGRRATRGSQLPAGYHEAAIEAGALGRAWVPPPSGLKQKDLVGSPWMVAFALRADGWYLRQDIIWAKPNPMPESVTDRCTKAHEYLFLLSKTERYFYDADAIAEAASLNTHARGNVGARDNGDRKLAEAGSGTKNNHSFDAAMSVMPERRNKRSVWNVATQPFPEAHFATFPPALIEPCVKAGTSERGCCVRCGAPWRRVTVNVDTGKNHKMPDGMATYAGSHSAIHRDGREKGAADNPVFARQTIGWYPACDHDLLPALPPYPAKPSRAALGDEAAYKAAMRAWGGGMPGDRRCQTRALRARRADSDHAGCRARSLRRRRHHGAGRRPAAAGCRADRTQPAICRDGAPPHRRRCAAVCEVC